MMPTQTKLISATLISVAILSACSSMPGAKDQAPLPAPGTGKTAAGNIIAGPLPPPLQAQAQPQSSTQAQSQEALARKENFVIPGTGNFVKSTPPAPQPPSGPEEFSLNFEATDIRAIVQSIMGDYLREAFTIHPQTTGTGTIRLSKPVSRKDLIPILEMMLRQNGQIMVKEEGLYKIMPATLGTRGSVTPQVGTTSAPLPPGFSVQIVQLKYVGAVDMQRILGPYVTDPAASVQIDPIRNLVIISGTQRELRHLFDIIDLFDVDFLSGYSVGLFQMSTDVKALNADLDKIFGSAAQSPLAGIVRIIPIERMNGLLVVTTQPKYLEEAKKWIERLDRAGGVSGGMRLNVYAVQHGKAEKLAQLLSEIYGKQQSSSTPTLAPGQRPAQLGTTPAVPGQPTQTPAQSAMQALVAFAGSGGAVSKDVRIIADNDNNALLILASPSDYDTIQNALRQLDVPRRQVSVEVLVAEVTLTDDLQFGIEWFVNARGNTVGSVRGANSDLSINTILPTTPGLGTTATGVAITDPRSIISAVPGLQLINVVGTDIRAALHALGVDGRAKTLSTPRLMVLDNEKASINVGDQISVNTGSTTGTGTGGNVVTTQQYLSTGIILNVTPRINAGGRVTLDVNQEVSTPGPGSNPNIATRKAQTVVTVSSGETMVLAGLIKDNTITGTSGLPLLSKIPIIGGLFGSQSLKKERTELVLLITPVVVTSPEDSRAVTEEIRKKLPSLQEYLPKATK